jgi:NMD protein affecting ribosome stability and mRNA decay
MLCPACGTENDLGRKFCGECRAALSGQTAASPWLERARAVAALEAVAG